MSKEPSKEVKYLVVVGVLGLTATKILSINSESERFFIT